MQRNPASRQPDFAATDVAATPADSHPDFVRFDRAAGKATLLDGWQPGSTAEHIGAGPLAILEPLLSIA
jgi:hypothetical protein